jgi:hypothetical protein
MQERMTKEITINELQLALTEKLIGCSIDKISYNITTWELRFIHHQSGEYLLRASEIVVPNIEKWWSGTSNLPVNIRNTNEAEDTISAINIFTVLNKWPVSSVLVESSGALIFTFTNGVKFGISAVVEHTEWAWQLISLAPSIVITCDSGTLFESAH